LLACEADGSEEALARIAIVVERCCYNIV